MRYLFVLVIFVGISRPSLDPTRCYVVRNCTDGWFVRAWDGTLYGNGKEDGDEAGGYSTKPGGRAGVLLGLGGGSVRFFRNSGTARTQHAARPRLRSRQRDSRPGSYIVAAVLMINSSGSARLLPNAQQPE